MRSILEELWCGNICPNDGSRGTTQKTKELMGYPVWVSLVFGGEGEI